MKKLFLMLVAMFLLLPSIVLAQADQQQERIISYDSKIIVNQDATLNVVETIKAHAEGDQIKHGIYRDFPIKYKDSNGYNYRVNFQLLGIKQDGEPQDYHTESLSNGIRIYIGKADVLLEPGDYTYEISYKVDRELGYFSDHDELYWNFTGNGWVFPIEKATAEVYLPASVTPDQIKTAAYTGSQGSRDQNFQSTISDNSVNFFTTQPLESYQGLTIVVGWPKGLVHEPTQIEKIGYTLRDNSALLIGAIGSILVFLYFLVVWWMVGRDPKKGTIIAIYDPPQGLSPAEAGYISRMSFGPKLFTATIINLAIKGYLKVEKLPENYRLTNLLNQDKIGSLPEEEKQVMQELFGGGNSLEVENKNHEDISGAIAALKSLLVANYQKKYFKLNFKYFLAGAAASLAILILTIFFNNSVIDAAASIFMTLWLSFWSLAVFSLWAQVFKSTKGANIFTINGAGKVAGTGVLAIVAIFFSFAEVAAIVSLFSLVGPVLPALIIILALLNVIFLHLLRAPTMEGRQLMDQIEGFKLFLCVTEKDRMNFFNPPNKTPELFEKYLPYALALGVENKWAEQFSDVFQQLHDQGRDYSPNWYAGTFSALAINDFASSLGSSFNGAISSAAVAPGSSSGFGGGGGSGGGGGGGGGGGW